MGGIEIINAVKENFTMKMLDIGWNAIGSFRYKQFAECLAKLFTEENLIHIDISHNNLNYECCKIMAKGLANNHTLIGIHADGNNCLIDSKGFMIPTNNVQSQQSVILSTRMQIKPKQKLPNIYSKCWICEGWCDTKFIWIMVIC